MLGTTIAVGLGPYIGGMLYDNLGSAGCFLAAAIFSAIALLSMIFLKVEEPEKITDNNEYGGIEKVLEYSAVPVSLFTALTSLGYVAILSFYRLYAVEVNLTHAFSWFFIIYSVVLLASRPIAGKIQDNYGDMIICVGGIIAQAIGLFLIAVMPSTLTVVICAVCAALGFGTLNSACTTIVTRNTPPARRSYAISTFFIFCDSTMGFGPALLGSFVSQSGGYAMVYMISAFITLLALPICVYSLKKF